MSEAGASVYVLMRGRVAGAALSRCVEAEQSFPEASWTVRSPGFLEFVDRRDDGEPISAAWRSQLDERSFLALRRCDTNHVLYRMRLSLPRPMLLNPDDSRPPWSRTAVPVGEMPGTVILRQAYPPLVWGRIRHPSFFFEKRA
jgi:hypothetical protein